MSHSSNQIPHTRNKTSSRSPVKSVPASGFTVKPEDWKRSPSSTIQYPHPPQTGGVTETIFGIEVKDPWRALEDLESDETKAFVKAQNKLSLPRLSKHPLRKPLEVAVAACYNHEHMSNPELQGDGYYYWRFNPGTAPRDVIVRSRDVSEHFGKAPGSEGPDLFYDLNKEEKVSLYADSFSPSGRLWCAVLQYSGSDWQRLRIIDTRTKEVLERDLGGSKFTFGVTWVGEKGFIYKRSVIYDPSNDNYDGIDGVFGMFYHAVGQPQSTDVLLWSPPDGVFQYISKTKVISVNEQEGSGERAWLALDVYRNTSPETELLVIELPGETANPVGSTIAELVVKEGKWLSRGFTGETIYIGSLSSGRHLFTSFTDGHSTGRIVAFDSAEWETTPIGGNVPLHEIIPDDPSGYQLRSAHVIGDQVIALIYLKHACASVVFVDARTGKRLGAADAEGTHGEVVAAPDTHIPVPEEEISRASEGTVVIPEHGAITSVSARPYASDFYFTVDTWVAPSYVLKGAIIKNKAGSLEVDISNVSPVDDAAPHEALISSQVFYDSHDGTRIPMFICHPQDLDLSKPHPLLLHAYGGFCAPVLPHYDPMFATFMRNMRGIVAIAGIRGGGEYGTAWHQAAIGVKRSVSYDDFASAAIHLQSIGLTTPSLTAIYGSSHGGTLMSASTIRHPELFEVVFVDVALTDLVRYHKFGLGRMWMDEYGSPDDRNDFPIHLATSPLHNVNPDPSVEYPAMLITTGDHDNRVMPGHSLKFIAELQARKPRNPGPILGRIYADAGHELGTKSTAKKVEEAVDRLVFALDNLGSGDISGSS